MVADKKDSKGPDTLTPEQENKLFREVLGTLGKGGLWRIMRMKDLEIASLKLENERLKASVRRREVLLEKLAAGVGKSDGSWRRLLK